MKKLLSVGLLLMSPFFIQAQDEFQLKTNDKGKVFYQGVIESDSSSIEKLMDAGIKMFKTNDKKILIEDREIGLLKGQTQVSTTGQRPDKSREYYYTFTFEITLEFKDGKVRYTLDSFKKKSAPGEPGSTFEAFQEGYNPKISSESTRDKAAQRLDKMEITVQNHVDDIIVMLRDTFDPSAGGDW